MAFMLGVFSLMGIGWLVWPAEGVSVGGMTLRYASLREDMQRDPSAAGPDIDAVLDSVRSGMNFSRDTLDFYAGYFRNNPHRIYLPDDDYTFFDDVFEDFEAAVERGTVYRVAHYGDSQIEGDRISSQLREALQERFGGEGTGMFPALSNVPSASILRFADGPMVHYTMYGDTTTVRAPHCRYGVMAQLTDLGGAATVSIRATTNKNAPARVKTFSRIGVLLGRNSRRFSLRMVSDTIRPAAVVLDRDTVGAVLVSWDLPHPVSKATLYLNGTAEIYGIMADGASGVAVDNIPLRGCSGTIFTRIDSRVMSRSMASDSTRLIILQFGGNYMPVATSSDVIGRYGSRIAEQIQYFRKVAPRARILMIGPSDMGKSVGGRIKTWPRLPELVDTLKATALRNGAAYWDLYGMMGGENSMVEWVRHKPALAGPDYIHFTPLGAQEVGDAFARSLLVYHDFYLLRKEIPEEKIKRAFGK